MKLNEIINLPQPDFIVLYEDDFMTGYKNELGVQSMPDTPITQPAELVNSDDDSDSQTPMGKRFNSHLDRILSRRSAGAPQGPKNIGSDIAGGAEEAVSGGVEAVGEALAGGAEAVSGGVEAVGEALAGGAVLLAPIGI